MANSTLVSSLSIKSFTFLFANLLISLRSMLLCFEINSRARNTGHLYNIFYTQTILISFLKQFYGPLTSLVSLPFLPKCSPYTLALSLPSFVRSLIKSFSNSAIAPSIVNMSLPAGVAKSICSFINYDSYSFPLQLVY